MFEKVIGNDEIKQMLAKSIEKETTAHSYLFIGIQGIGKKMLATEMAKKLLCINKQQEEKCKSCTEFESNNHPDYTYIEPEGNNIKIEQIRFMQKKIQEKPILSKQKVYIINDADTMTIEAQNCLLKTLEEPPEFVVIILISSNENIILNTIKSRCMTIKFHNINDKELLDYAINVLEYENVTENLLKVFDGSIGKAIKLKDNKEIYDKIDLLISNLENKDLVDIMLDGRILYDKENINDMLDYIIVALYSKRNVNQKYINCIDFVNECANRLKANSNFDMSIDNLLFKMWEELN